MRIWFWIQGWNWEMIMFRISNWWGGCFGFGSEEDPAMNLAHEDTAPDPALRARGILYRILLRDLLGSCSGSGWQYCCRIKKRSGLVLTGSRFGSWYPIPLVSVEFEYVREYRQHPKIRAILLFAYPTLNPGDVPGYFLSDRIRSKPPLIWIRDD